MEVIAMYIFLYSFIERIYVKQTVDIIKNTEIKLMIDNNFYQFIWPYEYFYERCYNAHGDPFFF